MFLRKLFFVSLLLVFSLTVFGYGIYKAQPIILGPKVTINYPANGTTVDGDIVQIGGTVARAKALYINKIPTAFTENGNFGTRLAVYPGNNLIIVEVLDRFGRITQVSLNIGKNK